MSKKTCMNCLFKVGVERTACRHPDNLHHARNPMIGNIHGYPIRSNPELGCELWCAQVQK